MFGRFGSSSGPQLVVRAGHRRTGHRSRIGAKPFVTASIPWASSLSAGLEMLHFRIDQAGHRRPLRRENLSP